MKISIRKNKKNNTGFLICIVLFILITTFSGIWIAIQIWEENFNTIYQDVSVSSDPYARIEVDGEVYVRNPSVKTMLFLGIDTRDQLEKRSGYKHVLQSDFIGLMVIDNSTETYSVLQLNRDTMMEMSVLSALGERIYDSEENLYTLWKQLTLAYNYGDGYTLSAENTAFNVSLLLNDVSIDHYVVFGMQAIPMLNDLVGGIEVTIKDDLTSVDPTLIQGETILLDGNQAMNYVQSRMTVADGTNINRMARQQEYLSKLYEAIMEKNQDSFLLSATDAISDYMFTDTSVNTLSRIASDIEGYEYLGFIEIDGTANYENEVAEYYLDEDSRMDVVLELFYEKSEYNLINK